MTKPCFSNRKKTLSLSPFMPELRKRLIWDPCATKVSRSDQKDHLVTALKVALNLNFCYSQVHFFHVISETSASHKLDLLMCRTSVEKDFCIFKCIQRFYLVVLVWQNIFFCIWKYICFIWSVNVLPTGLALVYGLYFLSHPLLNDKTKSDKICISAIRHPS